MPVHQQQDAAVVVARLPEPSRAQQAEVAVVGHVHPAHPAQDVGQGAVPVSGDLFRRDEGDRCRCLRDWLNPFRGTDNAPGVEAHQFLETEVAQRLLGRSGPRHRGKEQEEENPAQSARTSMHVKSLGPGIPGPA